MDELKKTFKGCGFGVSGNCCNICFSGPCRLDPFTEEQSGKCDFNRLKITIANLLVKCNYQMGKLLDDSLLGEQMNRDSINDTIIKSVKWISRGGDADETEGVDLFIKASCILLDADLKRAKAGKSSMIDPQYKAICCVEKESIDINRGILKDKAGNCEDALPDTAFSLLSMDGFDSAKDHMALVCNETDLNIWPVLCGLGSAGFTVASQLPLPVKINRRILDMVNELLDSGLGGKIIELSNNQ